MTGPGRAQGSYDPVIFDPPASPPPLPLQTEPVSSCTRYFLFQEFNKGRFSLGGNLPNVPANVRLHKGWFDNTLPPFAANMTKPIMVLHVDCDLYSSTVTIFKYLKPFLIPGSLVVFDELVNYPRYLDHEMLAFYEFLQGTNMDVELIGKWGGVVMCPTGDAGAASQAVAVRLVQRTNTVV